jgi:DNA-binding response OmpR family regulator
MEKIVVFDEMIRIIRYATNPAQGRCDMTAAKEKTVLVVEDDPQTAALVSLYLEREGFQVATAGTGAEAVAMADRLQPDLVVLDLMLPEMDGWEVCRRLRKKSEVAVIMLTARGEEIDRVAGLTLGADDYVVKPFSPRELVARVQAVLRRSAPPRTDSEAVFVHRDLVLDTKKHQLRIGKRPVALTPHEFALLETLMADPGRAFTREELLRRLYPRGEAFVIDRVVDVHIGKLRQKIESDPSLPQRIFTVRGVGYRFADAVSGPGRGG